MLRQIHTALNFALVIAVVLAVSCAESTEPTLTDTADQLPIIDCGPDCIIEFPPLIPNVRWIEEPSVTPNGDFYLVAEIREGYNFQLFVPDDAARVDFYDHLDRIRSSILPPTGPDEYWAQLESGQYVAEEFTYKDRILTVRAKISSAAALRPDLEVCIWSAQPEGERAFVGCDFLEPVEWPRTP